MGKTVDEAMRDGIEGIITPGLKGNSIPSMNFWYSIIMFFYGCIIETVFFFLFYKYNCVIV